MIRQLILAWLITVSAAAAFAQDAISGRVVAVSAGTRSMTVQLPGTGSTVQVDLRAVRHVPDIHAGSDITAAGHYRGGRVFFATRVTLTSHGPANDPTGVRSRLEKKRRRRPAP